MQIRASVLIWFFVKFVVIFCVLVFPQWSAIGRTYATCYSAFGNFFLDDFGDDGYVHFDSVADVQRRIEMLKSLRQQMLQELGRGPNLVEFAQRSGLPPQEVQRMMEISVTLEEKKPDPDWGVVMHLVNRRTSASMNNMGSSRFKGFLPTAFVVSLILATPVTWKRRGIALLWGIPLACLFVGFRLYIFLMHIFTRTAEELGLRLAVYDLPEWIHDFIGYLAWVFDSSFAGCFVLAGCIWFLVTFRRSDVSGFLESFQADAPTDDADET